VAPAYGENSGFETLSSSRCRCYPVLECDGAAKGGKTQANRRERNENRLTGLTRPQELEPAQESGPAEEVE